jgi:hypothetical protein
MDHPKKPQDPPLRGWGTRTKRETHIAGLPFEAQGNKARRYRVTVVVRWAMTSWA